jgi:hypothetical protein
MISSPNFALLALYSRNTQEFQSLDIVEVTDQVLSEDSHSPSLWRLSGTRAIRSHLIEQSLEIDG